MSRMNIQRVQLPDGKCLTIEGGTAEDTARLIANHYLGQRIAVPASGHVSVLPLPSLNFRERRDGPPEPNAGPAPVTAAPGPVWNATVPPLPLPKMTF